jgi:hypothetical protein
MDEAVEEAVLRDPREHVILAAAEGQNIPTMLEDGMEKVFTGATSIEELARVIEIPLLKEEEKIEDKPDDKDLFLSHVVT